MIPKKRLGQLGLIIAIALGALALRITDLDRRPMHHDEANQAVRFGLLLETGEYRYDPAEHHGPALYYLSLPFARLASGSSFAGTTETTLRLLPVLAGTGLVLLLFLVADGMGKLAAAFAGLLTAVSPAMVYYSGYYIHEMLFVFFTFGAIACGWRYAQSRRLSWAIMTGLFLGLMHATKESCVVAYTAMGIAACATMFVQGSRLRSGATARQARFKVQEPRHPCAGRESLVDGRPLIIAAIITAVVVSVLFYSSFFTNWRGVVDSVAAYGGYLQEAVNGGDHGHPWYYYLQMFAFSKSGPGPFFSEALILVLALVGCASAFVPKLQKTGDARLTRFIAVYTVVLTVIYSASPYKTPWCALSFLHGMILLAGVGAVALIRLARPAPVKTAVAIVLVGGCVNLALQARLVTGRYCADPRNPYAYSQTSMDFLKLVNRIEELSRISPEGKSMLIAAVTRPHDYWPLPWYLRGYRNVGYWTEQEPIRDLPSPSILIVSPDPPAFEEAVTRSQKDDYQEELYCQRQGVFLRLCIRRDLWNAFMETQTSD